MEKICDSLCMNNERMKIKIKMKMLHIQNDSSVEKMHDILVRSIYTSSRFIRRCMSQSVFCIKLGSR